MSTMTNPNPCIGSAVLDNAPDGSALFRALGGHYTSPAQAVCEFIDDSLSSIAANGDEVGEFQCLFPVDIFQNAFHMRGISAVFGE